MRRNCIGALDVLAIDGETTSLTLSPIWPAGAS
jgi:hypothetical protein